MSSKPSAHVRKPETVSNSRAPRMSISEQRDRSPSRPGWARSGMVILAVSGRTAFEPATRDTDVTVCFRPCGHVHRSGKPHAGQVRTRTTRKPITAARVVSVARIRAEERSIEAWSCQLPPLTTRIDPCPSSAGLPSDGVAS